MTDTARPAIDLYELLPAYYRLADAERGEPLRGLLNLIAEQALILKRDIDGLWDDLFIETCASWVIPYIGDLVGNVPLHGDARGSADATARARFPDLAGPDLRPPPALRTRADVAKTIYYRRRKGTLPILEELARDVTGWAAHAIEFFELLDWAQNINHHRPHSHGFADIRKPERAERAHGPFDAFGHSVDVRAIGRHDGWHNIKNIGFFLWRLQAYPLSRVRARPVDPDDPLEWRFHASPLGAPMPLFTRLRREGDAAALATELHVPGPIRPAFFYEDLQREGPRPPWTDLYAPIAFDGSILVVRNQPDPTAPPEAAQRQIVCRRLDPWLRPSGEVIAIDVATGRIAIGEGIADPTTDLSAWFHYGFSADLGGGPYDRRKWLFRALRPEQNEALFIVREDGLAPATHTSVSDAVDAWLLAGRPNAMISVQDSRTYDLPPSIELPAKGWLVIEAGNRERPLLRAAEGDELEVRVAAPADPDEQPEAALTLSGVVLEGFVHVTGELTRLDLIHATLVPGRRLEPEDGAPATTAPSVVVAAGSAEAPLNARLEATLAFSITGPLRMPAHAQRLVVLDSIVDGIAQAGEVGSAIAATGTDDEPGPPAHLERTTVFGAAHLKQLDLASEVVFDGLVEVTRRQAGCVRFSYLPPDSTAPRRYRCQPDLAIGDAIALAERAAPAPLAPAAKAEIGERIGARLTPHFTAVRYGHPAYAQLRPDAPCAIRTGAEDGSEMGAFSHLKQPQRESNLRLRLEEYLPFGLEAGLIYVT